MQAGNVLIDGLGVGDVGNIVLRDRKMLSQDGILVVVVTLGKDEKKIISGQKSSHVDLYMYVNQKR